MVFILNFRVVGRLFYLFPVFFGWFLQMSTGDWRLSDAVWVEAERLEIVRAGVEPPQCHVYPQEIAGLMIRDH